MGAAASSITQPPTDGLSQPGVKEQHPPRWNQQQLIALWQPDLQ